MKGRRAHLPSTLRALGAALASAVLSLAPAAYAKEVRTSDATDLARPAGAYDAWRGLGFGSYLAPKSDFVAQDGGVDVVFHFHAGQMAERQMKESGTNAVFVSCGYGIGSGAYASAFADPQRFGRMLGELIASLERRTGKKGLRVRHLALASWSAGFAAIGKILGVDRYYAMVDAVVLNDSLHSQYKETGAERAAPSQGADRVDLKMIGSFIRFAKDAATGGKTMVITHSSIIPPDYASSSEATQALLQAIQVSSATGGAESSVAWRGMPVVTRADAGHLHVRGFGGRGPRDHFEHLYLLGESLSSWVVPRWKHEDRLVYTLAGEQL